MTAPTHAEIHESILRELGDDTICPDDFAGLVDAFRAILDSDMARTREPDGWCEEFTNRPVDHPGTIWADLTRDETAELHDAMHAVLHRVIQDATRELVAGCVVAAGAFAEAHPDIPRGRWRSREPVPA